MSNAIKALRQERVDMLKTVRDIAAKAEARGDGGFTDDERAQVTDLLAKAEAKQAEINRAKALVATAAEVDALLSADEADDLNADALKGAQPGVGRKSVSIGRAFTDADNYKSLIAAHGGHISDKTKGIRVDPVRVSGGLKALVTGADHETSAGVLVQPDNIGLVPYPRLQPRLRDLITVGQTGSDRVEYAQVLPSGDGSTSNARGVPEATTAEPVGSGDPAVTPAQAGVKPESDLRFRKAGADVITIAHWLPITKRGLSDAAQVRTLIDGFLRDGVADEVERLIAVGDADDPAQADAEEWDGILNTTGVQAVDSGITDPVKAARRIIRLVAAKAGQTTAFAVSPEVNEYLDLLQDSTGRFIGNGPFSMGPGTLWGRPRVEVPALSGQDVQLVGGDFRTCVLWDREDVTISATDAHADFFVRNLVAVLAEGRAAFGVLNPQLLATAEVDLDDAAA